jgi:hypothetical protein
MEETEAKKVMKTAQARNLIPAWIPQNRKSFAKLPDKKGDTGQKGIQT